MNGLRFEGLGGAVTVVLAGEPLQMMASHRQLWPWSVESGGLLFAPSVGSSDGVVPVSVATPPHPTDRAARSWLKLDHDLCQREIHEQFALGLHFVGYWHTHPELRPSLSSQDRAALRPLHDDPGIDLSRLVMVVIGGSRQRLGVQVSILDRPTRTVHELTAVGEHLAAGTASFLSSS